MSFFSFSSISHHKFCQIIPNVADKDNAIAIGASIAGGMINNNLVLGMSVKKYYNNLKSVLQVNLCFIYLFGNILIPW
jgi:hypothetical protein